MRCKILLRRYLVWHTSVGMNDMSPLRAFRRRKGKTLRDMAADLGISEGQLSRIETSGTTSLERAVSLSKATGLPVDAFMRSAAA